MKPKAVLTALAILASTASAEAAENAADLVAHFKQWCLAGPLDFTSFSAEVKRRGLPLQFDRKSPAGPTQVESLAWEAKGTSDSYGLFVTTGTKDGKPIPMSCSVATSSPLDPVLKVMQADKRFGPPKEPRNTPGVRSFVWDGPLKGSEIQLIELNTATPKARVMINLAPKI